MSLVDQLPNDIFQVIFSFVDKRKDNLSIMLVCKKWNKFAYKYLDFSINDQYAIRWASENGYLQIVTSLLKDSRVDPSAEGQYAIKWASQNGHHEVVETLLKDSRVGKVIPTG